MQVANVDGTFEAGAVALFLHASLGTGQADPGLVDSLAATLATSAADPRLTGPAVTAARATTAAAMAAMWEILGSLTAADVAAAARAMADMVALGLRAGAGVAGHRLAQILAD
eukprot:3651132-Prymnesium_polylepis.1